MNDRLMLAMRGYKTMRCALAVVLIAGLTGCGGGRPNMRLGCLPFPGMLTIFSTVDAANLGTHHASRVPRPEGATTEHARGIVYSCRGGFLDMAHIRNAADWVQYNHTILRPVIAKGDQQLKVKANEGGRFYITFDYPDDWDTLGDDEREALVDELSLRAAQQLTLYMLDWHEMLTWFGYASYIIVPETSSAFTYEDMTSHLLGTEVAIAALRKSDVNFNQAVTDEINAQMQSLGALTPDETRDAIYLVYKKWWTHATPLKRMLVLSLPGTTMTPWLVPEVEQCPNATATSWTVSTFQNVNGRDLSGFMHVEIEPKRIAGGVLRRRIEGRPKRLIPEEHFPQVLDLIRQTLVAKVGPDVDQP